MLSRWALTVRGALDGRAQHASAIWLTPHLLPHRLPPSIAEASANSATAIGSQATCSGAVSLCLGTKAQDNGYTAIVLSGISTGLVADAAGLFVDPVRSVGSGTANLVYDTVTHEIYVGSSSRRYKKDIEDVQAGDAARVWDLRPVSYRALEADAEAYKAYGFIAEEVRQHHARRHPHPHTDPTLLHQPPINLYPYPTPTRWLQSTVASSSGARTRTASRAWRA